VESWLAPYMDRMEELSRRFFRYFHSRVEEAGGLSPSQFFVLKVLAQGTVSVSDLAVKLGMTAAGATGLVDRLVKVGLVERHRDEADRRIVWVGLSEAGRIELDAARQVRRTVLGELFSPLTPAEVQQLVALYEKVAARIPGPEGQTKE
jgi:MarR family transcriptional regulator, organic hydroperoxide resistance regulator